MQATESAVRWASGLLKILETGLSGPQRTSGRDTVEGVLITIIVAVGAAVVAAGVVAGQRDPEPALIPIPVKRPRRRAD